VTDGRAIQCRRDSTPDEEPGIFEAAEEQVAAAITSRRLEYLAALDRSATADPAGTKTGPIGWTGGELAFSVTFLSRAA